MKSVQLFIKSILDMLISLISLIILAIPFLIIALAIKLDSKGPIFFSQERERRSSGSPMELILRDSKTLDQQAGAMKACR